MLDKQHDRLALGARSKIQPQPLNLCSFPLSSGLLHQDHAKREQTDPDGYLNFISLPFSLKMIQVIDQIY